MSVSKEDLLKTDPALNTRPYQIEVLLQIFRYEKCLVKMFCGTGKSRIITNAIIHEKKELSVVVFPSLALIQQYWTEYVEKYLLKYKKLSISSLKERNDESGKITIRSTTDSSEIKKFLKFKSQKIILVTYQSYQTLLDCLDGKKIGLVCYDEAHHVTSPEYQKLVFGTAYYEKEVFFTATPKNENGIIMFDRENPEKNMCGPVAYEYTYLQGLYDEVLNAFEVCVDMFTENTNASIYEAIARAILTRGTNRVLTFHSGVNGESNTNVKKFVNLDEFQTAFDKVFKTEFPEKAGYYKKITFKGMDGKTPPAYREKMLSELDDTPTNEIYIISSCETIGEGVDTKKANMCVFADPKSSIYKIIQNMGRVVRRNPEQPLSTVLIPCWVNLENYAEAQEDKEKQDELIRQQMRATNGDYAPILNVLGALKQEDPELYEACLNYPNRRHKEKSLAEQGFRIADMDEEADDEDYVEEYSAEEVQEMKETGEPLEIHTNDTIERFNEDSEDEPLKRLYHDEEEDVYKPIVRTSTSASASEADTSEADTIEADTSEAGSDSDSDADSAEYEDDRRIIQPPNPKPRGVGLSIHQNDDIQMLWGVKGELDFSKKFCSVVIECEVVKIDQMELAIGIVERAKAREANGENLFPKYKHKRKNDFEKQETRDHKCIGRWKRGESKLSSDVREYLDSNLPNWGYILTNENKEIKALISINELIDRALKRVENEKNFIPILRINATNKDEKQETIDARKINNLRQKMSYPSIKNVLDECMTGWNNRNDWKNQAIIEASNIIKRSEERVNNKKKLLPTEFKHPKNLEEEQEVYDKRKISGWHTLLCNQDKRSGVCPLEVQQMLDEKMPGWRPINKDEKSLINAHCIIKRAKERQKLGLNLLPSASKSEHKDYCRLNDWKSAVENNLHMLKTGKKINKCKSACSDEVKDLLDKELPGWRPIETPQVETPQVETPQVETPQVLAPPPKPTKQKKQTAISTSTTTEKSEAPHHFPPPSAIGLLHKTYLKMRSDTLNQKFKNNPQLWREYHTIRKQNFATYPPEYIPANRIIHELEKIQTKRQKVVVDMGCGEAPIAHHFRNKNDNRFTFHNYDHQSGGDALIKEVDISALPLEDAEVEIAIMSLALWGTQENCTQYIKEAYRVLESGGKFYIGDSTKKWSPDILTPENGGERLRTLLKDNGFKIINEDIGSPFCFFECVKQ